MCLCLVGFLWGPDPSEAPSLVLWLTFTRVQHCTVQQLGWERGTPLLPIQLQARPLARCSWQGGQQHCSQLLPHQQAGTNQAVLLSLQSLFTYHH